jgi:hypothetical protein
VIVNINSAYEGIEKVSKGDAVGKSYLEVCPHYKDTAIEESLRRVARKGVRKAAR